MTEKECFKRGKSLRGKFKFQNRRCRLLLSFNEITKRVKKRVQRPRELVYIAKNESSLANYLGIGQKFV